MGSLNKEVQFSGCLGHHGPYSFYKYVKIDGRILGLSSFFPVRIFPDSAIFSIAEVQLLWSDRAENFVSLRLYFLPENTPEGRLRHHGEDEVIALQDKVIIRASDLSSWLVEESEWDWGYLLPISTGSNAANNTQPDESVIGESATNKTPTKKGPNNGLKRSIPRDKFLKSDKNRDTLEPNGSSRVLVVNYQRYVRVRTLVKRLEGSSDLSNWLSDPLVHALGGINIGPECRLLFSKEVFDYPELEDHELLCNHLAPKLKGRPRKRTRKRDVSGESESNNSTSSGASSCSATGKKSLNGLGLIKSEPEKQQVPCESPTSITSEESHAPDSPPPDKVPSGNEENDAPLTDPGTASVLNSIENKTEKSPTEVSVPKKAESAKGKGPVRKSKKRKGVRQQKLPVPPRNLREISPDIIHLKSTTVKKETAPPVVQPSPEPQPTSTTTPSPKNSTCNKEPSVDRVESRTPEPKPKPPTTTEPEPEKMESLQISPLRPSVITKQATPLDMECNGVLESPKKLRILESSLPNIPSAVTVKEGPVLSESKVNCTKIVPTIHWSQIGSSKHVDEIGPMGDTDKTTLSVTGPFKCSSVTISTKVAPKNVDVPSSGQAVQPAYVSAITAPGFTTKLTNRDGTDKPTVSITTIETESKRHNVFRVGWGSPSQFLPTNRIYGDPAVKGVPTKPFPPRQARPTAVIPAIRPNGVSITQAHADGALDFSLKRAKLEPSSIVIESTNLKINGTNNGWECLDLTVDKPQSKNMDTFQPMRDIPPPNAVNQHGLRLTSEVTLYPSPQKHKPSKQAPPPQVHVKRTSVRDSASSLLHSNNQFALKDFPLQAPTTRHAHVPSPTKQRPPPEFLQQSEQLNHSRQNSVNPKSSANPYNHSSHPPSSIWKAPNNTSILHHAGIPAHSPTSRSNHAPREQSHGSQNPNHKHSARSLASHSPPTDQQRPQLGPRSSDTPPKHSPNATTNGRRTRQPSGLNGLEQLRERNRPPTEPTAVSSLNPYGNFTLPAPPHSIYGYNYNPHAASYFPPHFPPVPYGLPPQSLLRFGPMEPIHLAYMQQQGLSPHAQAQAHLLNWGASTRESRSGSQK